MDFSSVLNARHSVRIFSPRPVPRETLTNIVRDAQTAPSCLNSQPWKVWIAVGEPLERIRAENRRMCVEGVQPEDDLPRKITWSDTCRATIERFEAKRRDAGLQEIKMESQSYLFHAPALAVLTVPKLENTWAAFDLGAFEQTLLLAAASRGIGSIPAYNLVRYPALLHRELGIPETEAILVGIALGYEADEPINRHRSDRHPVEEVLTIVG